MSDLTNAEKRAIWMEAYNWQHPIAFTSDYQAVQAEALRRYPDPKPITDTDRIDFLRNHRLEESNFTYTVFNTPEMCRDQDIRVAIDKAIRAQEYSERTK